MKQTLVVKLAPEPEQSAALLRTLEVFNAACNDSAGTAFAAKCATKIEGQKLVYYDIGQRVGVRGAQVPPGDQQGSGSLQAGP